MHKSPDTSFHSDAIGGNSRGFDTEELRQIDRNHYLHPFTDSKELHSSGSRIIVRGEGVYLWDSDGNQILDGMAGLWCVNLGYGNQELISAATNQLQQLAFYNSFFKTATPPAVRLAEELATIAPSGLNHVFFTNSGSEANDTVVRMARYYWALRGQPNKNIIISRKNAYHGSTMGGASLGGMAFIHKQGGLPIPNIEHVEQPYWFGCGRDQSPDEFGRSAAKSLEKKIVQLGENRVAAFIAEPVQGAGGIVIPPESYWPAVKQILAKYDILFVADEVICGFGRTGEWFGSHCYDLQPDLVSIAKALTCGYVPMGGVLVHDRIAALLIEQGGEFAHGFTYSGHPVAAAVALANLRILKRDSVIDTVRSNLAPYFAKAWMTLSDHPLVGEARCLGMLGAIELVAAKQPIQRFDEKSRVGTICRDICFENGVISRAVGDTMIVCPPLVISNQQIDELVGKLRCSLDSTRRQIWCRLD